MTEAIAGFVCGVLLTLYLVASSGALISISEDGYMIRNNITYKLVEVAP